MNQELSLSDQIILLSLNDDDGTFDTNSIYLSYTLIGSGLAELLLTGFISINDQRINIVESDHTTITNPFIQELYQELKTTWDGKKIASILNHFARYYKKYQDIILVHLVELGILKKENHKILWVFNSSRYPEKDSLPEGLLRSRLKRVISGVEAISERDICLFKFLNASGLIKQFTPKDKKTRHFKKEIEQLLEKTPISENFKTIVKAIEDGIITAIVMITVVT